MDADLAAVQDVPGMDVPGMDVPGMDVPGMDVPGMDAAGEGAASRPAGGESRAFAVRVAGFEGPFDLLLSLIAKHRIEVTELALHTVTDDFIAHVRAQGPEWDLDEATSFLVIAATLLDLKAARLLPDGSVEDEEDLALLEARDLLFARLLQYRAFKEVAALLDRMVADAATRRPRDVGLEPWLAESCPRSCWGSGRWSSPRSPSPRSPRSRRSPACPSPMCTPLRSAFASRPPSWSSACAAGAPRRSAH